MIFLLMCLLFFGFLIYKVYLNMDYEKNLSLGYSLVRTNAFNHSIIKNDVFIIESNVVRLFCNDSLIIGYRQKSQFPDYIPDDVQSFREKSFGLFLIAKDGAVKDGLTEDEAIKLSGIYDLDNHLVSVSRNIQCKK